MLAQAQEQPTVTNAQFETRVFSGDLGASVRATEPTWFAYAVKTMRRDENCCFDDGGRRSCFLEDHDGKSGTRVVSGGPIKLDTLDHDVMAQRIGLEAIKAPRQETAVRGETVVARQVGRVRAIRASLGNGFGTTARPERVRPSRVHSREGVTSDSPILCKRTP